MFKCLYITILAGKNEMTNFNHSLVSLLYSSFRELEAAFNVENALWCCCDFILTNKNVERAIRHYYLVIVCVPNRGV